MCVCNHTADDIRLMLLPATWTKTRNIGALVIFLYLLFQIVRKLRLICMLLVTKRHIIKSYEK